jgi:hypothetical protein
MVQKVGGTMIGNHDSMIGSHDLHTVVMYGFHVVACQMDAAHGLVVAELPSPRSPRASNQIDIFSS